MAASKSAVDICNKVTDMLGQPPISSITPGTTTTETLFARHYDDDRRALLRNYVWNFAKRRVYISRSRTPEFDYADAYTIPKDVLRILSIGDINGIFPTTSYKNYDIEDNPQGGTELLLNTLVTNTTVVGPTTIPLRYIADITDVGKFDTLFSNLLTYYLGMHVAYQITKKNESVERMNKLYTLALLDTISIDGQENPPSRIQRSKWLAARRRASLGNSGVAAPWTIID